MKKQILYFGILSIGILASCNQAAPEGNTEETGDTTATETVAEEEEVVDLPETYEIDGVKIYPATASVQYEGAKLALNTDLSSVMGENEIAFDFEVEAYELGAQTADAEEKGLANSPKGQHIHLIVDNGPYSAHYDADFTKSFDDGHHVAIAFLSRSYHESVKNAEAHQVFQFNCGAGEGAESTNLDQPLLFYSRPKGTYSGDGAQKILLDFFLKNTEIAPGGNTVQVTVNDKQVFAFDTWQPYYIEGLEMGENTINLQLLDSEGNMVDSPMNNVTRTFTLAEATE